MFVESFVWHFIPHGGKTEAQTAFQVAPFQKTDIFLTNVELFFKSGVNAGDKVIPLIPHVFRSLCWIINRRKWNR